MNPEPSATIASPDRQLPPSTPEVPRKRRHYWIWALIFIAFALLFYWVISQHRKSQAAITGGRHGFEGPVPIVPATATKGSLGVYLPSIGTVTSVYFDSINAEVTGVVTAVHYREGEYVRKGEALIDIDPRPYQAQLMEAQGALQRDQGLLAEAQMDLQRYQLAWSKNAIPRQTLEDQEKLVQQDEGTVKNDQGLVQYDQVQVDFCHITAPITGRVGLRLVDPGNLVTANSSTTLVVITQMQPITVIFPLAEDSLPQVLAQTHHGVQLTVQAWDRNNQDLLGTGKVIALNNQIDTTTGTVNVRAEFQNANGDLFPNQFVNTRLLVTTVQNQTIVPSSAIQHNGDTAFVFLVKPGPGNTEPSSQSGASAPPAAKAGSKTSGQAAPKAQYHVVMTTVKTGVTDNGMTAVTGIQPGNVVANSSFEKLVDGSSVYYSNQKLNIQQTSISGESNAP
ncbi:MAG TPA: efflux RND transporter periplasmic adaptor subunit [Acidobacteriaceae bacterium]|nr:efflux RND transporter periplasmic adaptor subunit [Acidobacteriaceae bacterium]